MSPLISKPIPAGKPLEWQRIWRVPIIPVTEPLIDTADLHPRILSRSDYYQQKIAYSLPACYLRNTVANKLIQAVDSLPDNLCLLLLDCWRPVTLQRELQRVIGQRMSEKTGLTGESLSYALRDYVADADADPMRPSPHLTGGAVDLTLCDKTGDHLDMGGAFDEPSVISHTCAWENTTEVARNHRRLLYWSMTRAGFTNLPTEWWHFDYGNQNWGYFSDAPAAMYGIAALPVKGGHNAP